MKKKTTHDIMRDGEALAMRLSDLFAQEERDGLDDAHHVARAIEQDLAQYENDLAEKFLAIDFATKRAAQNIDGLKAQIDTFKRSIKAAERTIERCKELSIAIFHSRQATLGMEEGRHMKLPDQSKAWLVQKEATPRAVWAKRNEHLLPADVKVEDTVTRVDKDLLLEWAESATPPTDDHGEPVVRIEWVDPTHTRRR